jgi:hypothetical protein
VRRDRLARLHELRHERVTEELDPCFAPVRAMSDEQCAPIAPTQSIHEDRRRLHERRVLVEDGQRIA